MKHKLILCLLVVLCASLVSCAGDSEVAVTPTVDQAVQGSFKETIGEVKAPQAGKATAHGLIFSTLTDKAIGNIFAFLAPVTRQGEEAIFILDISSSPTTEAAKDGTFVFENITSGEYVLVIGDPFGDYRIITDEEDHPKVWNLPANQITEFNTINVDL